MAKLTNLKCSKCGLLIESENFTPNSRGGAPPATSFESCLRHCEKCGIGYSNIKNPSGVVKIYRNPLDNIPPEMHDGALETLSIALNEFNRENKLKKFAFETSEDALTWTVFNYLKQKRLLCESVKRSGVKWLNRMEIEPTILLWGVPMFETGQRGNDIRNQLINILFQIGEEPRKYSEPDVILDFGNIGVVFIEVKYRSSNERIDEKHPKWGKYLKNSSAIADINGVKKTGYYELARNWRIAWDLAGDRSIALLNLGPNSLFKGADGKRIREFGNCLNQGASHKFIDVTWKRFLEGMPAAPGWFNQYLKERNL